MESPDVVGITSPVRRSFHIPARNPQMLYLDSSDSSDDDTIILNEEEYQSTQDGWSLSSSSMEFEDLASNFSEDSFSGEAMVYHISDEEQ